MKATGIIRRIDDLGRVVIPKEIRRTLNIREGDPLEIYRVDNGVVFKPYKEPQVTAAEFATEWLSNSIGALNHSGARFTIEDTTVICEVVGDKCRHVGTAKCNSAKDAFNPTVGMVIAWHRAMGEPVPAELL